MAPPTKGSRRTSHIGDVFVLGAGVSVPYGFPTGADLLRKMRQEKFHVEDQSLLEIVKFVNNREIQAYVSSDPDFDPDLWESSDERRLCDEWKRLLRGSVILTIDQFLRNVENPQHRELGKRLMARQILNAERSACSEASSDPSDSAQSAPRSMHALNWIQEFLTRVDLLSNWEEYLKNTAFLTFNYDRVLEFFLHRYLTIDRRMSKQSATDFLQSMTIVHLNGYLGSLEQIPFGNLHPFGNINRQRSDFDPLFEHENSTQLEVDWGGVVPRMRTVWDHVDGEIAQRHLRACRAVSRAQRIFALGMSFIPENLSAIGLTPEEGGEQVTWARGSFWATRKRLSDAQTARAAQLLGVASKRLIDSDARDFVVDHVVL